MRWTGGCDGARDEGVEGGHVRGQGAGMKPGCLHNVGEGDALGRVDTEHAADEVCNLLVDFVGYREDAGADFCIEAGKVVVVEGEPAGGEGEENDAARPYVCGGAVVELA